MKYSTETNYEVHHIWTDTKGRCHNEICISFMRLQDAIHHVRQVRKELQSDEYLSIIRAVDYFDADDAWIWFINHHVVDLCGLLQG